MLCNKMKTAAASLIILMILNYRIVFASPLDDLGSPTQDTRDRAAAELSRTFRSTPMSKWTPTIDKIKKGQSKKEILDLLSPFNVTKEGSAGSGQSHSESYRLDNEWVLICWFQNAGDILIDRKLTQSLKHIWTAPPKNYTGVWVVYFVNGHKSHQINYKDGQYFGEFISYHPDGSKSYVQHYTTNGANGEDTGYYPSGKIAYRAQYKDGKPVGTWTWYDEAGEITSTQEHGAP
jgi:hypothetical protein